MTGTKFSGLNEFVSRRADELSRFELTPEQALIELNDYIRAVGWQQWRSDNNVQSAPQVKP